MGVVYTQTTNIIKHACAIHINYWKWVGLSIGSTALYTSSLNSDVPVLLASGAIAFQR